MSEPLKEKKIVRSIAFYIFMFFVSIYLLTSSDTTVYDTDASLARYEATKSSRSPIFTQFKFIYNIAVNLKNYSYFEPQKDAKLSEIIEASPYMNVFDFWWIYRYYIEGSYSGIIVSLMLLMLAIYAAIRLRKAVLQSFS